MIKKDEERDPSSRPTADITMAVAEDAVLIQGVVALATALAPKMLSRTTTRPCLSQRIVAL